MFGECHAHVIMDGINYKAAVALHKDGFCEAAVRAHLKEWKDAGITSIIHIAATLFPVGFLSKKKSGTPISAPPVKQISCRLVRLNMTFVLTFVKSLGTGT